MPTMVLAGDGSVLTRSSPRPAPHSPSQTRGRGAAAPTPMGRLCACVRRPPFTAGGCAAAGGAGLLWTRPSAALHGGDLTGGGGQNRTLPGNPRLSQNEFYPRGHRHDISGGRAPPPGDPARLRPHLEREVVRSIGIVGDVVRREVRRAAGSAVRMRLCLPGGRGRSRALRKRP